MGTQSAVSKEPLSSRSRQKSGFSADVAKRWKWEQLAGEHQHASMDYRQGLSLPRHRQKCGAHPAQKTLQALVPAPPAPTQKHHLDASLLRARL